MTRLFIEASRVDKSSRQPQRDMSYAAIPDLREQYHPGDELTCVVKQLDRKAGTFEISVKETVPNPFNEASLRHPSAAAAGQALRVNRPTACSATSPTARLLCAGIRSITRTQTSKPAIPS